MYKSSPSKIWRKNKSNFKLIGSKSKKTDKVYFPPVEFEPENNNTEFEEYEFEQKAILITWSIVRVGPKGFEELAPYAVGILELENGQRITGQITDVDLDTLEKGDVFYTTFRKIYEEDEDSVIEYGLKWTR